MIWSEGVIARAIARQVFQRRCLLLVDNCNWTGNECDVLGVAPNLKIIDVEIKISRADLKADAGKYKWWRYISWEERRNVPGLAPDDTSAQVSRQWPTKVWKHYYAMPADIWRPELADSLASTASGVILLRERGRSVLRGAVPIVASVERRARPNPEAKPLTAAQVIDVARLASLRMWSAYERAEEGR